MNARNLARNFALAFLGALLVTVSRAEEVRPPTNVLPSEPTPKVRIPEARNLAEALAQIAGLEGEIARLKAALAQKEKAPAEPAAAEASKPEPDYQVRSGTEDVRFLDLGVRRDYMAAERERLIDQLHTMIPPLYEPAFSPFHGYTLPPRAFRVALDADRFTNHHDFGRDEVYERFFDNVKVENQHVDLDVFYGIDQNDTVRLIVPFRSTVIGGTGKAFRIEPMVMTMNGSGYGLGDVQLTLKRKWFDQAYTAFNFATVLGVQFPTGKHDERFSDAQTIFMNGMAMPVSAAAGGPKVDLFSDDLRIPNSAQPGTGSWGVTLGAMATRQITWSRSRGAVHGGILYKAMRDNDEGVRPGNELVFGVSYVRPPFRTEHLTFDITLFGRHKQSELYPGSITHPEADENGMPIMNPDGSLAMFTTPRPPFEHGTVAFLSPSLVIIPKPSVRLTVSPMFRVYEPEQGPSPSFRLVFGATTTF